MCLLLTDFHVRRQEDPGMYTTVPSKFKCLARCPGFQIDYGLFYAVLRIGASLIVFCATLFIGSNADTSMEFSPMFDCLFVCQFCHVVTPLPAIVLRVLEWLYCVHVA